MQEFTKAISLNHWYYILLNTLPKLEETLGYLYLEYEFTLKVYIRKTLTNDGLVPVRVKCDHDSIWSKIYDELNRYETDDKFRIIFYDMNDTDDDYALIFGGSNGTSLTPVHPI